MPKFDYHSAFSRNIGWLRPHEQDILRTKRIAIAGLGGVGGSHLLTLTRLGIGAFHVADLDFFELANFNRQAGAFLSRIGQDKVDVLTEMALDINPELDIRAFPSGIEKDNISTFLDGVDLYVDGLDYFAISIRRAVFAACAEKGIPAVTAAPLGMGAAVLSFLPGKMGFEEYFQLEGHPEQEQFIRFLLGLSPAMLQRSYLVHPEAVDFLNHKGPSTPMACEICAGMAASQALKILLNRGKVPAAPHGLQFDAFRNKMAHTWRPWGNRNPLQKIGLAIARKQLAKKNEAQPLPINSTTAASTIERILDLARWAPSGDNSQPWRFEILDDRHLVVHGFDTRDHCVYDLQGHASQISLGIMLETITIAASTHGLRTHFQRRPNLPDTTPTFDVTFSEDPELTPDPLATYVPLRTVQRRPMHTRPLTPLEKQQLEAAVGSHYQVQWFEGFTNRWRFAQLTFKNAGLRLTLPEAYPVHRDIIEWNAQYSEDKIPDQAVGSDPITTRLMRWTLQSWNRVAFMNRYLAGTLLPRIELDLIPGLACAAHFALLAKHQPGNIDDFVAAGRSMQRFWLTATKLGLHLQPEMTPLIFHEYVRNNVPFSQSSSMHQRARAVSQQLCEILQEEAADQAVFLGRIGSSPIPKARSIRLPLKKLMHNRQV